MSPREPASTHPTAAIGTGHGAFVFALGLTLLGVGCIGELGMGVTAALATAIADPVVGLAG